MEDFEWIYPVLLVAPHLCCKSVPLDVFSGNEVFQFKEWCYSLSWLSMLCGDPLKRRTDRGSHQVTWPARWMCMRGKKRKRGTICPTHFRSLPLSVLPLLSPPLPSLSVIVALSHTHWLPFWCLLLLNGGHEKRAGMMLPGGTQGKRHVGFLLFTHGCFWLWMISGDAYSSF